VVNGSTLKDLGLDVREARKERSWTQVELAQHANVAATLVGKVERGKPVSDTTLKAIAKTLDLPDAMIAPHLTEASAGPTTHTDPAPGTFGHFRRELAYFHGRFKDTPADYERLLALVDLVAALERREGPTEGGLQTGAQSYP
jgi:XRE family transcriptional regulator, regulator of sulfur utilization